MKDSLSTITDTSQPEQEPEVSRRKPLGGSAEEEHQDDDSEDDSDGQASGQGSSRRKRKRSRKGLDKKYHCEHDGCDKAYSRAEHLYRHQLNHSPKRIYTCDFPECHRQFVRQDLCARHRERHTNRSQMQRRESALQEVEHGNGAVYPPPPHHPPLAYPSPNQGESAHRNGPYLPHPLIVPPSHGQHNAHSNSQPAMSDFRQPSTTRDMNDQYRSPSTQPPPSEHTYGNAVPNLDRSYSDGNHHGDSTGNGFKNGGHDHRPQPATSRHRSSFGAEQSVHMQSLMPSPQGGRAANQPASSSPHYSNQQITYGAPQVHPIPTSGHPHYAAYPSDPMQAPHMASMPPPPYPHSLPLGPSSMHSDYPGSLGPHDNHEHSMDNALNDGAIMDSPVGDKSVPIFGGEAYAPSPTAMIPEDIVDFLFGNPRMHSNSPDGFSHAPLSWGSNYHDLLANGTANLSHLPHIPHQHPMAVANILDHESPPSILSETKRQVLLKIMRDQFNPRGDTDLQRQKMNLLNSDSSNDDHVLSLRKLQTYIGSYWYHFHPQMPILHKATFCADEAQNLLLLSVIILGASCLDKAHGLAVTTAAAELSNFIAWGLRGELFDDPDFRPPAKLWVFQALLLLEIYEKMYATRALHERAHIHHGTTLTLMRRGSSLRGRSALDSPPSLKDGKPMSPQGTGSTRDGWWTHWIINEANRRVAFAAFIVDSTHATMFGHSATLNAHEMRLPLPCDEALWSAPNAAEVSRIETALQQEGVKSVGFLEGLKATLSGKSVRTNSFGRSAIMAGLLSVSWHMHQRDVQVQSLGVRETLGGKTVWRGSLTKSFDYWESDFEAHAPPKDEKSHNGYPLLKVDDDNLFETRTTLHHLAHMAMHVDIVKCQIFAKAHRLLGRTITPAEYKTAQQSIRNVWAPKPSARDATFYALQFLTQVLAPDLSNNPQKSALAGMDLTEDYNARNDFLLNRPWVLYFAALIVWSYGYALDGVLQNPPKLTTVEEQRDDMRAYLKRVGGVKSPEDLMHVRDRNSCLGLLMILRNTFRECRWELMHEAANLLRNCINFLEGSS